MNYEISFQCDVQESIQCIFGIISDIGSFLGTPGGAAAIGLAGGLATSLIGSNAASDAAKAQQSAANTAAAATDARFQTVRNDLNPFTSAGYFALGNQQALTGNGPGGNPLTAPLTKPFSPADLTQTPGYQFTLQQGLKGVQNGLTAQGLGAGANPNTAYSGVAARGVTDYATGLADTTFNQQLQNYLQQNNQIYNMLQGQVQLGQNSAAQTGAFGTQATQSANQFLTSGAAAGAAGTIGSANAAAGGINQASQAPYNYLLLNNLLGRGTAGSGGGSSNA